MKKNNIVDESINSIINPAEYRIPVHTDPSEKPELDSFDVELARNDISVMSEADKFLLQSLMDERPFENKTKWEVGTKVEVKDFTGSTSFSRRNDAIESRIKGEAKAVLKYAAEIPFGVDDRGNEKTRLELQFRTKAGYKTISLFDSQWEEFRGCILDTYPEALSVTGTVEGLMNFILGKELTVYFHQKLSKKRTWMDAVQFSQASYFRYAFCDKAHLKRNAPDGWSQTILDGIIEKLDLQ